MPQDYFQFRKFRIEQQNAAMRVSTDACIQAAVYAQYLSSQSLGAQDLLLDIGAGTGLLGIMLAQAVPQIKIIGIEPNEAAALDCIANYRRSSWSERLVLIRAPLQEYEQHQKAAAIICNPPFFQNHLKSKDGNRSAARHDSPLTKQDLIAGIQANIAASGSCCIMYPDTEWDSFLQHAAVGGLHLQRIYNIKPKPHKKINRKVGIFAPMTAEKAIVAELLIRDEHNTYSSAYKSLLQPFFIDEYFKEKKL